MQQPSLRRGGGLRTSSIHNPVFAGSAGPGAAPDFSEQRGAAGSAPQAAAHSRDGENAEPCAPCGGSAQPPSLLLDPDAVQHSDGTGDLQAHARLSSLERAVSLASGAAAAAIRTSRDVMASVVAFGRTQSVLSEFPHQLSRGAEAVGGDGALPGAVTPGEAYNEPTALLKAALGASSDASTALPGQDADSCTAGADVVPAVGGAEAAAHKRASFSSRVKRGLTPSLAPPGVERTTEEHLLDAQERCSGNGGAPSKAQRMWALMRALVHGGRSERESATEEQARAFPRIVGQGILVRTRSSEDSSVSTTSADALNCDERCGTMCSVCVL